jgi:hypothetical protein
MRNKQQTRRKYFPTTYVKKDLSRIYKDKKGTKTTPKSTNPHINKQES